MNNIIEISISDKYSRSSKKYNDFISQFNEYKLDNYHLIEENEQYVWLEFTLYNRDKYKVQYKKISLEQIVFQMETKKEVDIEDCYLQSFNINSLPYLNEESRKINSIKARNSFIGELQLSLIDVYDGIVDFTNSIIFNINTRLYSINFYNTNVFFRGTTFISEEEISFFSIKFYGKTTTFANSYFEAKNIIFMDISTKSEYFDFTLVEIRDCDSFSIAYTGHELNKMVLFDCCQFDCKFITFSSFEFGYPLCSFNQFSSNGRVVFLNSFFKQSVSFDNFSSEELLFDRCDFTKKVSFYFGEMPKFIIKNCIIEHIFRVDYKTYEEENVSLNFQDNHFIGTIHFNNDFTKVKMLEPNNIDEKIEFYKVLKDNYNKLQNFDNYDLATIAYHRANRSNQKIFSKTFNYILDLIGNYGINPKRTIGMSFIVWFLFAIFYSVFIYFYPNSFYPSNISFVNGLYFSAITFLTIGYGDIQPISPVIKITASLEGFLGLLLMSYITVSLVRKFMR